MVNIPPKNYVDPRVQAHQIAVGAPSDPTDTPDPSVVPPKDTKGKPATAAPGARRPTLSTGSGADLQHSSRALSDRKSRQLPAKAAPARAGSDDASGLGGDSARPTLPRDKAGLPTHDRRQRDREIATLMNAVSPTDTDVDSVLKLLFDTDHSHLRGDLDVVAKRGEPWVSAIAYAVLHHLDELSPEHIAQLAPYMPDPGLVLNTASTLTAQRFGAALLALATDLDRRAADDAKSTVRSRDQARQRLQRTALDAVLATDVSVTAKKVTDKVNGLLTMAAGQSSRSELDALDEDLQALGLEAATRAKLRYLLLAMGNPRIAKLRKERDRILASVAGLREFDAADPARKTAVDALRTLYSDYAQHCIEVAGTPRGRLIDPESHRSFIKEERAWLRSLVDGTGNWRDAKKIIWDCLGAFERRLKAR